MPNAIQPGKTIIVQREKSTAKIRYTVVGFKHPDRLLAEPVNIGAAPPVLVYDKCQIHFFEEGSIHAFQSSVINIVTSPFPMTIFEYHEQHQKVDVRKAPRLTCHVPARFEPMIGANASSVLTEPHRVTLIDLSKGGAQIAIPVFDAKGYTRTPEFAYTEPIRAANQSDYSGQTLRQCYKMQEKVHLQFSLCEPVGAAHEIDVAGEICAIHLAEDILFVSIKFIDVAPAVVRTIEKVVKIQLQFYTARIHSPSSR